LSALSVIGKIVSLHEAQDPRKKSGTPSMGGNIMICRKCRRPLVARLAVAAGLAWLAACQTGPVDSGGRGVQVSDWQVIDVAEVDLDFPLLITPRVTRAEYQNRDNQINHHRLLLDGGNGSITTQRFPDAWYGDKTQEEFADVEIFKAEIAKYFKEDFVGFDEIRPARHAVKKSFGFVAIVDVKDRAKDKCLMAKMAYRLKPRTFYDNDVGNVDVLARFRYCGPNVKIGDFLRALENVETVTDRPTFAAALAAK
jgi:hypothetical protein